MCPAWWPERARRRDIAQSRLAGRGVLWPAGYALTPHSAKPQRPTFASPRANSTLTPSLLAATRRNSLSLVAARCAMKVSSHVYYIFGGASGLGEATARRLHSLGAYVAIFDRNEELSRKVADSLNGLAESGKVSTGAGTARRAMSAYMDITRSNEIAQAIAQCDAAFKGVPVGGAVIASGIGMVAQTIDREGEPHDLGLWETIQEVNLTGTFNAARLVAARLVRDVPKPIPQPTEETPCRGVIITVASQAGLDGQAGQVAYAASKAGVVGMTLPMAR